MSTTVDIDVRSQAAARFAELGWPTTRHEAWRYTNLAPLQKVDWRLDDAAPALPAEIDALAGFGARAAIELVFLNGRLVEQRGAWSAGIREASRDDETIARFENAALAALNLANAQDGARIEIADGTIVDGFIHLLFIGQGDGIWSHPRNVIVAGRHTQVAIVETWVGSGAYFSNGMTEIVAREGAVVDHTRLQIESPQGFHVGHVFVNEERAAAVTLRNISLGGALARVETHVSLAGEGASVSMDGLFVGSGTQHLDNVTVIDHVKPHCESLELYKGVLDQNARGVFDGKVIVRPDAQKTVSRQENRNLLLSESAIVDSKPTLEIHNDDVKCNHGSTIGQLNEETIFYLRSRGIGEEEARGLLVHAFASEIVDRIRIEPVREQVRRALFRAMPERMPERRGAAR